MTKKDLAQLIKNTMEVTNNKEVDKLVEVFETAIRKEIIENKECKLLNLGTFKVRERAARTGRNPQTGETLEIPASKTVGFKPSASFKSQVQ